MRRKETAVSTLTNEEIDFLKELNDDSKYFILDCMDEGTIHLAIKLTRRDLCDFALLPLSGSPEGFLITGQGKDLLSGYI